LKHGEDFLPYFQEKRTHVNQRIRKVMGAFQSKPYLIESQGRRPATTYSVTMVPGAVRLPSQICDSLGS